MMLDEIQRRGVCAGTLRYALAFGVLLGVCCFEARANAQGPAVETVLKALHRPCGIAARPGGTADRYEIFIAESGAGRVVRWTPAAASEATPVVTGFETRNEFDRFTPMGPVALWFLDPGLLIVGTSSEDASEIIRTYELPDDERALDAGANRNPESDRGPKNSTTCLAMTRSRANEFVPDALLLVVSGTDGNELLRARVQAGTVGKPQSLAKSEASQNPRAIATSPTGRIVVGDETGRLAFHSPIDGEIELSMETGLKQLVGLAYSPTSGSLYAADFDAGIYRIDDASEPGLPACHVVKVADIARPSALTFAPDGSLFVVTFGDANDDGTLQVVTGNL